MSDRKLAKTINLACDAKWEADQGDYLGEHWCALPTGHDGTHECSCRKESTNAVGVPAMSNRDELAEALTAHVPAIDQRETFCLCGVSTGIYNDAYATHILDVLDTLVASLLAGERERCARIAELMSGTVTEYFGSDESGRFITYQPNTADIAAAIRAAENGTGTP